MKLNSEIDQQYTIYSNSIYYLNYLELLKKY